LKEWLGADALLEPKQQETILRLLGALCLRVFYRSILFSLQAFQLNELNKEVHCDSHVCALAVQGNQS